MSLNAILGTAGENAAAEYLAQAGYRIVARNFRTPLGEIDLIARDGDCLCFIEVKTRRSSSAGSPGESVHFFKRRKLVKLAFWYMKFTHQTASLARFDVVGLSRQDDGELRCTLLKNAFDLNDAGY